MLHPHGKKFFKVTNKTRYQMYLKTGLFQPLRVVRLVSKPITCTRLHVLPTGIIFGACKFIRPPRIVVPLTDFIVLIEFSMVHIMAGRDNPQKGLTTTRRCKIMTIISPGCRRKVQVKLLTQLWKVALCIRTSCRQENMSLTGSQK